jgi:hypothetical protein
MFTNGNSKQTNWSEGGVEKWSDVKIIPPLNTPFGDHVFDSPIRAQWRMMRANGVGMYSFVFSCSS